MINKLLSGIIIIIALSFAVAGCRSTKKIRKAISVSPKDTAMVVIVSSDPKADSVRFIQQVFHKVANNYIDFKTFSAKIKVNYEGGDGKNYDLTAFLHIQKDSMIWVSVNAILGSVEVFRILITPDSVKMVDKIEKKVQVRAVSYLQEVAHIPLDFKTLQNLLVGNPVYLDSNVVFYRAEEKGLSLMSMGQLFKNYITFNRNDYTVQHSKLDDVDALRARTCDLTYGDYEQRDSIRFSTYRKISVAEKSKLDVQLSFKQFNFNVPLSFSFPIPKNYKTK